jgi:hypothetical protein
MPNQKKPGGTVMHAYNLFRRKHGHDIFCAVPEDCIVPAFLDGALWEFSGKIDCSGPAPVGFDSRVAPTAVRFNGCYLFEPLGFRAKSGSHAGHA